MATKRAWLSKLKKLKSEPAQLTPAECDELILLLGGTVRGRQRPENILHIGIDDDTGEQVTVNRRRANWTAIADVVFNIMANAEPAISRSEAERMASKWFTERGKTLSAKQIKNELDALRKEAGLKRLGLAEWRVLNISGK